MNEQKTCIKNIYKHKIVACATHAIPKYKNEIKQKSNYYDLSKWVQDKIKEADGPNGVINLLHCNNIKIVQHQSLQFEKIFEINL